MRAAAAALSAEDSERAASILDQGIAAHSSPASRAPKRNRRRSKRQSAQTQALLSNMP
jgi:hypothetical protein